MTTPTPPRAILLDLDDTILDDSGNVVACWRDACRACTIRGVEPDDIYDVLDRVRRWYWSDAERHRAGRLDLEAARLWIVNQALGELGVDDPQAGPAIAAAYSAARERGLEPIDGALDTVTWLRSCGYRLALLTNGAGPAQRKKIDRFNLSTLFDSILVEGELGFGKPDSRVYALALKMLNVAPSDAMMIGDNLEWDVAKPQEFGIAGVWIDVVGSGLPATVAVQPHRIIRRLSDIRKALTDV